MKLQIVDESLCTGCSACSYLCKNNAVSMAYNSEGFKHSVVDEEKCNNCELCFSKCPVLRKYSRNSGIPESYAVVNQDDIREVSSSGGAFSLFAEEILALGGVCFGVTLDRNCKAKYTIIDNANDLKIIRGSKYIYSDMSIVYLEIRKILKERKVLFTGLPCQVAGLYSFLENDKIDNLYTIDLLCLGIPSDFAVDKYLKEISKGKEIKEIRFREKREHGKCDTILIIFTDGTEYYGNITNDVFEQAYHNRLMFRKSCEMCEFASFPRVGDLSIGDFHEIDKYDQSLDDGRGISNVFVNNDKGNILFKSVKSKAKLCKLIPLEVSCQNRVQQRIEVHPNRDRFFKLLKNKSFDQAVKNSLENRYDIVIIGIHTVENHGSNLSYYALYRTLSDMGYDTLMVERPESSWWKPHNFPIIFKENPYEENNIAKLFLTKNAMRELNSCCDTFVLGSDQLWYYGLYDCFDQFCYLDYIYENKNKIAYAASFGRESMEAPKDVKDKIATLLKRFDSISMREQSAVENCEKDFGIYADYVLDPVFLCDVVHYDKLILKSNIVTPQRYIVTYILDPNLEKQTIIQSFSRGLGIPVINMTDVANVREQEKKWGLNVEHEVYNEDWLKYIKNAEIVITDSFHGTCFSIIFEKKFYSIVNEYRGKARFESLLGNLGLSNRMIYNCKDINKHFTDNYDIDYEIVNEKLANERERSLLWLKQALKKNPQNKLSEFDILGQQIGEVQDLLKKYINYVDQHGHVIGAHDERLINYDNAFTNIFESIHSQKVEIDTLIQRIDVQREKITNYSSEIVNLDKAMFTQKEVIELLSNRLEDSNKRLAEIETSISLLKNSYTYRLRRFITFIPRKILSSFKKR